MENNSTTTWGNNVQKLENYDVIEFTLVRDIVGKVTRVLEGKAGQVEKSFQRDPTIRYHYTNYLDQFTPEDLAWMHVFSKESIKSPPQEGNMTKIFGICAKNKKEILHNEDIVLSDFSIWDRMEAHTIPRAHLGSQILLTCEYQNQIYSIFVLSGTYDKPVVCPYTTGWHIAATDKVKEVVALRDKYTDNEFHEKIFQTIRENMVKEIEEETGLVIDPTEITYFQADPTDPSKTYTHLPQNFSKDTKGNEEFVHIFHAHLNKNIIDGIVANHEDGIEGFVMSPFLLTEDVLKVWKKISLYKLNGERYRIHPREKFQSNEEYEDLSHLITINDMQQEYVRSQPGHIPKLAELVKANLLRLKVATSL